MFRFLVVVIMLLMPIMATAKPVIVVLGDSISAGYGIEVDQGWVALLQKKLLANKLDYSISNASISGDTSAGGLARIDQILTRQKPVMVLIELGANDGLRGLSPTVMKNNLAEIIRRVRQTDAKVMLLGIKIPPSYGQRYIELFYSIYPQLAKENAIPLIPSILEDVALVNDLMQPDGLHPNAKAQALIADKIAAYLFPLL